MCNYMYHNVYNILDVFEEKLWPKFKFSMEQQTCQKLDTCTLKFYNKSIKIPAREVHTCQVGKGLKEGDLHPCILPKREILCKTTF